MKRYFFTTAAVLSFALGVTGAALANSHHPAKGHRPSKPAPHGLLSGFAPRPGGWLKALTTLPRDPRAPHEAKPTPKPAPKAKARKQQPAPRPELKTTTLSIYEHSAQPWILAEQGCSAGHRHETGVVVLDFGKPAYAHGGFGTILFSGRFAPNHKITSAMLGYAHGYVSCLPEGSTAEIEIARGTSNYHPSVPSAYVAGVRWARETNRLGVMLARKGLAAHVEAAAADDAEPAWDPAFRRTRQFFHGFRAGVHGHTMFDYGSLDGGVGAIWSARQMWYVAGGLRHTKALPEIYNSAMAREWADLARIARGRYHRAVRFAGVMTQRTPSCDCGLRPSAAHQALADALGAQGIDHVSLPAGGTNIVG